MNLSKTHTRICHHCPPSNPQRQCGLDHLFGAAIAADRHLVALCLAFSFTSAKQRASPSLASHLALVGDLVLP